MPESINYPNSGQIIECCQRKHMVLTFGSHMQKN